MSEKWREIIMEKNPGLYILYILYCTGGGAFRIWICNSAVCTIFMYMGTENFLLFLCCVFFISLLLHVHDPLNLQSDMTKKLKCVLLGKLSLVHFIQA
jgi:hypothetical protein